MVKRITTLMMLILSCGLVTFAGKWDGTNPIFISSTTPENEGEISSFSSIVLHFDFTDFFDNSEYENDGMWGIGCNGTSKTGIYIYEITDNEETIVATIYENIKDGSNSSFQLGFDYKLSVPNVEVKAGARYKVVVRQNFFALKKGEKSSTSIEDISWKDYSSTTDDAYVFYCIGASEKLSYTVTPDISVPLAEFENVSITFDSEISLEDEAKASLYDEFTDGITEYSFDIVKSTSNAITFSGENVKLYNGQTYLLEIPKGVISSVTNTDVKNDRIAVSFKGNSYHYFNTKRGISPVNGDEVIKIDNIYIPFEFPEGYGFKATSAGPEYYTANIYKGGQDGILMGTYKLESSATGNSIEGDVDVDLEPGTEYTIVIPEGQLTIRNLNGVGALEGWTNGEIIINVTTPAADALGKVALTSAIGESMEEISGKLRIAVAPYTYNDETYAPVLSGDARVIFNEDGRLKDHAVELIKGEEGTYLQTVDDVNATLFAGKEYSVIVPANTVTLQHPFLGLYTGNAESKFEITGTTPTSVKVSYTVSDGSELTTAVARGEAVTFTPVPAEGWKVESVTLDGESVDPQGDEYVTPALLKDTEISVTYAYDGEIRFVDLSAVNEVTLDGGYRLGKDGEFVVVSNLKEGDAVTVYTVNGQQVASHKATLDVLKISLPTGLYVVRINNVTFKLKH